MTSGVTPVEAVHALQQAGATVAAAESLTGGLVVVSDRFVVESGVLADRALVGPQGVTIRTEGGTIGLAGGAAFALAENWSLGGMLRYGQWFLPTEPAEDALGSKASLTGRNSYVMLSLAVTYRSML